MRLSLTEERVVVVAECLSWYVVEPRWHVGMQKVLRCDASGGHDSAVVSVVHEATCE